MQTSGFSGPFISAGKFSDVAEASDESDSLSAIIERAKGNTNMAFWYILGTGIIGFIIICFVNVEKARIDVARCKRAMGYEGDADFVQSSSESLSSCIPKNRVFRPRLRYTGMRRSKYVEEGEKWSRCNRTGRGR